MDVPPLASRPIDAANLSLESLAANKQVPKSEKIAQASRAFEAVLLRQILSESQKPVFPSKYVGNSTADGIYRDEIVNQLADNISKSGSLGLGKSLARELQRQSGKADAPSSSSTQSHGGHVESATSNHHSHASAPLPSLHAAGAPSVKHKLAPPNGSGRALSAPAALFEDLDL